MKTLLDNRTVESVSDVEQSRVRIGHNGGPELDPPAPPPPNDGGWKLFCWRIAVDAAWKNTPREIVLRRLERAEKIGLTYRQYTLEILERGRYL